MPTPTVPDTAAPAGRIQHLLAAALLLTACARTTVPPPPPVSVEVWLRNVHIVDPARGTVQHDQAIGIAGGIIRSIMPSRELPANTTARIIDGGGAFATPGLWDAHVHLLQNDETAAEQDAALLLSYGVTHVRDMGSSLAARNSFLTRRRAPGSGVPAMIGAGPTFWAFSLPYGDKQQQVLVTDTMETDAAVRRSAEAGVDFIKVYAGFDRTRLQPLMRAAARYGLPVAGHPQPGMTLAEQATLGMRTIEHLDFDALKECTTDSAAYFDRVIAARFRHSGESIPAIYAEFAAAADTPTCAVQLRSAAAAGLVLTPTLVASYLSHADATRLLDQLPARQREGCALYLQQFDGLSDAGRASLVDAGRRLMRMVAAAGVPVLAGTDAPTFCLLPGASLAMELQLMADGGLSPLAVLRAATSLPARVFRMEDRFGALDVGRAADLVLLNENPLTSVRAYASPVGVYTQGWWYDAGALAALRQGR